MSVVKFSNNALGSIIWTTCVYNKNYEGSITIIGEKGTIKIGGQYTLSYDKTKSALVIDNGINTGDMPSVIFIGSKCRLAGGNDEYGALVVNNLWSHGSVGAAKH